MDEIKKEIEDAFKEDLQFSSGRILGSMCTSPHPYAKEAYIKFIESNLGDPELFKGSKRLEERAINFVAKMLHAPDGYAGIMTSGGTESNITAMWICRELMKTKKAIVPRHAHFSFEKALSMLGMKAVVADGKYRITLKDVKHAYTGNEKCVVAIAGNTTFGYIDEIDAISDFCRDEHLFLHIDAAFGGFVIPFLDNMPAFDFLNDGVSSIAVDAHKMGMSVIPSGFLIMRENWFEKIKVRSRCTHTKYQFTMLGTRPGAAAAASFAVMHHLGKEGYRKVVRACMDVTEHLVRLLEKNDIEYVKPVLNVVAIKVEDAIEVAEKLKKMGWMVGYDEDNGVIRIVVMPHVKKKFIDAFVEDLKKVVQ